MTKKVRKRVEGHSLLGKPRVGDWLSLPHSTFFTEWVFPVTGGNTNGRVCRPWHTFLYNLCACERAKILPHLLIVLVLSLRVRKAPLSFVVTSPDVSRSALLASAIMAMFCFRHLLLKPSTDVEGQQPWRPHSTFSSIDRSSPIIQITSLWYYLLYYHGTFYSLSINYEEWSIRSIGCCDRSIKIK